MRSKAANQARIERSAVTTKRAIARNWTLLRIHRLLLLGIAIAGLLSGCGGSKESPESSSESAPRYTAAQFFETMSIRMVPSGARAFSPDGKAILMSSDATGIFNVFALPVTGGEPEQLTHSKDNAMFAVSWFPDDERVLFTYDNEGNELNHVIVREIDGSLHDLTPGENLKARFVGWSGDGQSFYLVTTERNQRAFDVYRYSSDAYDRELIFENPGFAVSDISRDERWLALDKPRTSADSDIYLVDLASAEKEPVLITAHDGNIQYSSYGFTPDSRYLMYATDEFGEFRQAWQHDLSSGEKSLLIEAPWDVWYVLHSPSGRYRVSGVNADARTVVTVADLSSGEIIDFDSLPPGDLGSVRFMPDESSVAISVDADNSPSNIYLVDLTTGDSKQLTETLNPAIDPTHLVSSEVVRYESFDGLAIPGILYRPLNASAAAPVPALVWVHGGPGGQSRRGYSPTIQHLVNNGYAVLAANNRGSSGYGKTFFHLDDKRHGEEDLQDIVHARAYLESLDWIDKDKVGVIGGSYGGYMVAAALAFEPDVFDVGINIFGVTNWVRTLENIPPWWEDFKEALYDEMGDPSVDGERHRRISPLFHADNIVKPMLVVQGANDPRVLQVESDELVAAARANEVPVEYVLFPDEGHGFRKRENRIAASEAYLRFLDDYLPGN